MVPALCLLCIPVSGCSRSAVVALVVVATGFYGTMFAGVFSNHNDIASNYAGCD